MCASPWINFAGRGFRSLQQPGSGCSQNILTHSRLRHTSTPLEYVPCHPQLFCDNYCQSSLSEGQHSILSMINNIISKDISLIYSNIKNIYINNQGALFLSTLSLLLILPSQKVNASLLKQVNYIPICQTANDSSVVTCLQNEWVIIQYKQISEISHILYCEQTNSSSFLHRNPAKLLQRCPFITPDFYRALNSTSKMPPLCDCRHRCSGGKEGVMAVICNTTMSASFVTYMCRAALFF